MVAEKAKLRITGVTVHFPSGATKDFAPDELAVCAVTEIGIAVVVHKVGKEITRYIGMPTVIHEEESPIAIVRTLEDAGLVG